MFAAGFLETNLTFSLDNIDDESFNNFYLLFQMALFFITLIFLPLTVFVLYLMLKYPQFHINLVILYSNLYFSYSFLTVGRLISFVQVYYCGTEDDCYITQLFFVKHMFFAEFLKFSSLIVYFVASNCIVIERIWAIIYLKGYENKKDYKFIIIFIILQWAISVGGLWFALEGYVPIIICLFLAMFYTFASVLVFRYMDSKNQECYRLSKSIENVYTLTERYQIAENHKTAPLITAMINVNVILNTLILIVSFCNAENIHLNARFQTLIFLFYSQTVFKKQISKMIFDFLITVHSPILSSSCIYSIKKWRNVFKGIFVKASNHKITPRQDTVTYNNNNKNITNTSAFPRKTEADIYFKQLNDHWA